MQVYAQTYVLFRYLKKTSLKKQCFSLCTRLVMLELNSQTLKNTLYCISSVSNTHFNNKL